MEQVGNHHPEHPPVQVHMLWVGNYKLSGGTTARRTAYSVELLIFTCENLNYWR